MLRRSHDSQHPMRVQIRQQLMQLREQKALTRHSRQIAIKAVDHNYSNALIFHFSANPVREFSWRLLIRIDLMNLYDSVSHVASEVQIHIFRPLYVCSLSFVKQERTSFVAFLRRR